MTQLGPEMHLARLLQSPSDWFHEPTAAGTVFRTPWCVAVVLAIAMTELLELVVPP
eukprot:CAMPEP_0195511074 /NCGR_PEP_ID=MMETSP0794_2-20130614/3530_1 /TAXON_ID=515487 /ORGANISM="Stephanopyxis turris, Strain CCMP 815" /LENGTH=55 /DNA_ID=CAMNT_0040638617 /DNA_START=65 /DNA_END=230 /DNA_ORIENTATION=-